MKHTVTRASLVAVISLWVAACSTGAPTLETGAVEGPGSPSNPTTPGGGSGGGSSGAPNQAPTITLPTDPIILVGRELVITPTARDPEGRTLSFSVSNKPDWMSFSTATGTLRGTPGAADVGSFADVRITVSDGQVQATATTSIRVVATAPGRATLSWTAPTQRTDGSPLTDLAGFRVYFGNSRDGLVYVIEIKDPGARSWVVEDLTPGPWFFAATAFDAAGAESDRSNVASKTIA